MNEGLGPSEPLEIRLSFPAQNGGSGLRVLTVIIGLALVIAPVVAVMTQELDSNDRLEALMLGLAGLVMAAWGLHRLITSRTVLHDDAILRLGEDGVAMHTGSSKSGSWAHLTWPNVTGVELRWWEITPPFTEEIVDAPVLRFIGRYDDAIRLNGPNVQASALGTAFGLSPAAAALVFVLDPNAWHELEPVRAWLAANRPDLPVEIGLPPAH